MGKPDSTMIETALAEIGVAAERTILVGDRLETDVRMAVHAGMKSALVLTGDSKLQDLDNTDRALWPTFVLQSIATLYPEIKE
jgi:ribonucleotide monophosphatase NagD (HAD superfamily)